MDIKSLAMNTEDNILVTNERNERAFNTIETLKDRIPSDRKILDFIVDNLGYF